MLQTFIVTWISCLLIAVSVYKLVQSVDFSSTAPVNSRAAFYVVLSMPEFLAAASFFVPDLMYLFGPDYNKNKDVTKEDA